MAKLVLVTGGLGFIGRCTVQRLASQGYKLRVLDIRRTSDSANAEVVHGDVTKKADVRKALRGVDYVLHLAAKKQASDGGSAREMFETNVVGTQLMLDCAVEAGVSRFVLASSAAVYGDLKLPAKEDRPLDPISMYGLTKAVAENSCNFFHRAFGIRCTILRYFNVYGPPLRSSGLGIANLAASALLSKRQLVIHGDGEQTRDFVSVEDVAGANEAALAKGPEFGVFNVGSGAETSLNSMISMLQTIAGKSLDVTHDAARKEDIRRSRADVTRIAKSLGFKPKVSLHEGLVQLIQNH